MLTGLLVLVLGASAVFTAALGAEERPGEGGKAIAGCKGVYAKRTMAPPRTFQPERGGVRMFAMQFKQEVRHVRTYASFRRAINCALKRWVLPFRSKTMPNVVALNEDIGLLTMGTGSRGAAAREVINDENSPSCEGEPIPCRTVATLAAVSTGYADELAYYQARYFPGLNPVSGIFVGATDTFARGWMKTFSDLSKKHNLYMLGSNNQAPFRASTDPADIAALADPDLPEPPPFVYVATEDKVYNEVFMWAPRNVRKTGPDVLRNMVVSNRKVPLTSLEITLQISPGAATGPEAVDNLRPYRIPGSKARVGFATSLPAFVYGEPVPEGVNPCSDTSKYYMNCLDKLGTNVVIQDEANPGRWAGPGGNSNWQPLEWMASTHRAVIGNRVSFDYNVTPFLVGNLADIVFDGQSAITQRGGLRGRGCHFIGNGKVRADDPKRFHKYAGRKRSFLVMAPWVAQGGGRDRLRQIGADLATGSGSPQENNYLQTALIADLTFPPDPNRRGCITAPPRR